MDVMKVSMGSLKKRIWNLLSKENYTLEEICTICERDKVSCSRYYNDFYRVMNFLISSDSLQSTLGLALDKLNKKKRDQLNDLSLSTSVLKEERRELREKIKDLRKRIKKWTSREYYFDRHMTSVLDGILLDSHGLIRYMRCEHCDLYRRVSGIVDAIFLISYKFKEQARLNDQYNDLKEEYTPLKEKYDLLLQDPNALLLERSLLKRRGYSKSEFKQLFFTHNGYGLESFYTSKAWGIRRREILERDGFKCQYQFEGCSKYATQVDHITSSFITELCLDPYNLKSSCDNCHNKKHGKE